MGFFNVYAMRYSYVADHFAYQAVAVAAACAAGGIATLAGRAVALRRAAAAAGVAALAVLGLLTFRHAQEFRTADALWRSTLAENPGCFMCHTNYGFLLYREGRVADAIDHFQASLRLKPDNVPALLNLAKIDEDRGRLDDAAARLRAALALDPADPTVLVNLGTVYTKAGRYEDAVARVPGRAPLPVAGRLPGAQRPRRGPDPPGAAGGGGGGVPRGAAPQARLRDGPGEPRAGARRALIPDHRRL